MSNEFDIVYNGKPDAEVDLTEPGNPKVLTRKDGGGSAGDFREGTVTIRTKHGYLVIAAMSLEGHECFDVTYRRGPVDIERVGGGEMGYIDRDKGERPITALGFTAGERVGLEETGKFAKSFGDERVLGDNQGVRTIAIIVDKEEDA